MHNILIHLCADQVYIESDELYSVLLHTDAPIYCIREETEWSGVAALNASGVENLFATSNITRRKNTKRGSRNLRKNENVFNENANKETKKLNVRRAAARCMRREQL